MLINNPIEEIVKIGSFVNAEKFTSLTVAKSPKMKFANNALDEMTRLNHLYLMGELLCDGQHNPIYNCLHVTYITDESWA